MSSRRHGTRLSAAFAFLAGVIGFAGCRIDDALDDRIWPCKESSQCGTRDGERMTCWQGYCMPSCDPNDPPDDSGVECLESGALLRVCDPSPDDAPDRNDCPSGLGCFRTDLAFDNGLCVPFPVCTKTADCPGTDSCATEILSARLADLPGVRVDNLNCVQRGCQGNMQDCAPGTTCLATTYSLVGNDLPDICVPSCDSQGFCPPNYACARTPSAPGADRICVPGLPGVRCTGDVDCIVGTCAATDAGFSICTLPCATQEDCTLLNASPSYFHCVEPSPGAPKICVNVSPFQGPQCDVADDVSGDHCATGMECFHVSPYFPWPTAGGECRVPCDSEGRCPVRGGLAHVCLDNPESLEFGGGGCYPGAFSIPCERSSDCLEPFDCEEVEPDGRELHPSPKICTIPCGAATDEKGDEICDAQAATTTGAYCGGGFCRRRAVKDKPCERAAHCLSRRCDGVRCLE